MPINKPVSPTETEEAQTMRETTSERTSLVTYRERANSDDAQTIDQAFLHANARALVISNIQPNKLGVGGREFRVKRNPAGEGCFVYDPRTRFHGVKRNLVWWIPEDGRAYTLNSPSKMVTPSFKWPREEGIDAPSTSEVIDYVFEGKPMSGPSERTSAPKAAAFTVKEYRIYNDVISAPMSVSEAQSVESTANRYGVTVPEVRKTTKKVQKILFRDGWFSTPESEIRHASDWKGEKP